MLRKLWLNVRGGSSIRAVAFGLAMGLLVGLPPFGIGTLLFVVLFLVLNANLWAFVAAAGVGIGAQFGAPGVLRGIGRSVLEVDPLRGLWSTLLNVPGISTLGLDHYATMGGTLLAGVVAIVLLVIGIKRQAGSDQEGVNRRWIRRGFVVPVVVVLVLAALVFRIFGDDVAREAFTTVATQAFSRDVKVREAKFGLLSGSLELDDLTVRDAKATDGNDIASGKRISFDLGLTKLLNRRFVVDELAGENLVYRADASGAPEMPSPPGKGEPVTLANVLEFVEANEAQIRWALEQLDGFLRGNAEPTTDTKADATRDRAFWVYGNRNVPTALVRKAGVKNLTFDWGETGGLITKLNKLDLELANVSSNPVRHDESITLTGSGRFGDSTIGLKGAFDVRDGSTAGHQLELSFDRGAFGAVPFLGVQDGRGLDLDIVSRFDPASKSLRSVVAKGGFTAFGDAKVAFSLGGGAKRAIELDVAGLDVQKLGTIDMPDAIRFAAGLLDLKVVASLGGDALNGVVNLSAKNFKVAPGTMKQIAGLNATDFCAGLNALAGGAPIGVALNLGGTRSAPTLSLDATQMEALLKHVQQGLMKAGKQRLASEVQNRLGKLNIPGKIDEKLGGAAGGAVKDVTKTVEGALGGLFGGKKKEPDKPKK